MSITVLLLKKKLTNELFLSLTCWLPQRGFACCVSPEDARKKRVELRSDAQ
jgi:hypothetical protein